MKIVMYLAVLMAVVFNGPSHSEAVLRSLPPTGQELKQAIDASEPNGRSVLTQARKQVFPVFIFIPGILGSKLTRVEGENRTVIWGQINAADLISPANPALAYKDTDKILAEPLDQFYVAGYGRDVYGKAFEALKVMNTGNSDNVLWFPYDWRQSNKRTASDLSEWLCKPDQRSKIEGTTVVFIAHSMGGLVLKYWLKHLYDSAGCSTDKFSNWLKVRRVIFAGTPNYGAAKAASAFAQGFTLLVDPSDKGAVWKEFAKLDAATLSKGLNKYGIYFPSAYELLPIINRPGECLQRQGDPTSVVVQPLRGASRPVDLFSVATWREIGWPTQLTGAEREDFLQNKLKTLLSSAQEFLCDVGDYRLDPRFEVDRFVGDKTQTVCKITLKQPNVIGAPFTLDPPPELCPGDGTVPAWTAKEQDRSPSKFARPDAQSHDNLLGDADFLGYLDDFYRDLMNEFLQAAVQRDDRDATATSKVFSSLRYIPPGPTDVAGADSATATVASNVVQNLRISSNQIFDNVKPTSSQTISKSASKAATYRVFAEIPGTDPERRAWALSNSAHIYLAKKDFVKAENLGKRALEVADQIGGTNKKAVILDIKSKAALTVAIAANQLGQTSDANKYRDLAVRSGNPKAKSLALK
jgi:hypothetical protein